MNSIAHVRTMQHTIEDHITALPLDAAAVLHTLLAADASHSVQSSATIKHPAFETHLHDLVHSDAGQVCMAHLVAYLDACHALADDDRLSADFGQITQYTPYAFALAQLLGQLPLAAMTARLRACFPHLGERPLPITIRPWWRSWSLCADAEPRLERALEHPLTGVVLINHALLVKVSHGRMAGVALYHTPTLSGWLVPGIWYAPTDVLMQEALRHAFLQGHTTLTLHAPSTWAIIRPVDPRYGQVLLPWLREQRQTMERLAPVNQEGSRSERQSLYHSRYEDF